MQPRKAEIKALEKRLAAIWKQEEQEEASSASPPRFRDASGGFGASTSSLDSGSSGHSKGYRLEETEPSRATQPRSNSAEVEDSENQKQKRKKQRTTRLLEEKKRAVPGKMAVRGLVVNLHVTHELTEEKDRDPFERGPLFRLRRRVRKKFAKGL
jgi:hypothetical protein